MLSFLRFTVPSTFAPLPGLLQLPVTSPVTGSIVAPVYADVPPAAPLTENLTLPDDSTVYCCHP